MTLKKIIFGALLLLFIVGIYRFSTNPVVLRFFFPSKVWAHRVNSIPKLKLAERKFAGVELDVVWTDSIFDVNHPPAESINLDLGTYLRADKENKVSYWLDFKNLEVSNAEVTLNHLDSLIFVLGIEREQIIVESPQPEFLQSYRARGYNTSFYLPSGFSSEDKEVIQSMAGKIKLQLEKTPVDFISSSLGEYIYINEYFPDQKKLLWHLGGLDNKKNKIRVYKALLDNNVEVILFPYNTIDGDR